MTEPDSKLPTRPDESPPRNRFIAISTFVAVSTLIVLKFVFDSYFDTMMTNEAIEKAEAAADVANVSVTHERDHEAELLTTGPMPIDRAMDQLAHGGRSSVDIIRPQPSHDLAAQKGWDHLPDFVTSANVHLVLAPAATAPVPAPAPAPIPTPPPPPVIEGNGGSVVAPPPSPPPPSVAPPPPVAPAPHVPRAPRPTAPHPDAPAPGAGDVPSNPF